MRQGVTKVTIALLNGPRFPASNLIESGGMSLFQRHRWFVAAAGITLAFAVVSLTAYKSDGLTAFADVGVLVLMLAAAAVTLANAWSRRSATQSVARPAIETQHHA